MTTIHSRKLFLMLAVSLGLTSAYALETEQFVYSVENGEARVTGLTVAGQAAEMLSIPEKTVDGIPVTQIAYNAVRGAQCYGITIPNSVRYIGSNAFYSCPNLIYLEIPPSVTNAIPNAFVYDCPKLGEVAFCLTNETSAVKIGNKCLSEVPALTNVVVRGNGAMTLGDSAFYNLASIQAATLQGVAEIEDGSAWNTGAFNGCANLEQVTLIDSPLRNIGNRAFQNCAALASFAIPNTATNIGNYAFSRCTALKSATLPEGLLSMGLQSFANCTSLGEATLPDSLRETENYASYSYSDGYFAGCTSMTNLVIGSGIPVVKKFHLPFDSTNAFTVTVNGSGTTVIDCNAFKKTTAGRVFLNGVASIEGTSSGNDGAFRDCTSLMEVVFGDGLAEVGGQAFMGCGALEAVAFPNSVTNLGPSAFSGCTSLRTATLNEGLLTIGNYAFRDCTSLTEMTLPDSLVATGNENDSYAIFSGCTSMTDLTIGSGIAEVTKFFVPVVSTNAFTVTVNGSGTTVIDCNAFKKTTAGRVFLNGVASIEGTSSGNDGAFRDCTSLTEVVFGDGLAEVGGQAFMGCGALEVVAFPNSVTNLGSSAFSGCTSLRTATLNEGLLTIGNYAFRDCTSLTEMTLPDSLVASGNENDTYAIFSGCTSITDLTIGSGIAEVTKFFVPVASTNAFSVTVNGSGATVIDCKAFKNTKAGSIVLNGVASIEGTSSGSDGAFSGCSSLTNIVLGAGLAEVGGRAFYNCSALGELVLPESVETIGNYAFQGTTSLTNIVFQGETAPALGDWAFNGTSAGLVFTVPFDGTGYGIENGATGNWATIAAEKVQYTGGAESGYGAWAVSVGLAGKGTAAMMGGYGLDDKVANAFIYAFGDAATNAPLMTISFDENGKPVITTPSLVRTEGMTLKILSTTDLADWSNPEERALTVGGNGKQTFNHESDPQRFYKLKAE